MSLWAQKRHAFMVKPAIVSYCDGLNLARKYGWPGSCVHAYTVSAWACIWLSKTWVPGGLMGQNMSELFEELEARRLKTDKTHI